MSHVFISYSIKDIDFAQLCEAKLKAGGIETWIDHHSMSGGELWRESIDEGIQSSDAVIVIISPNSNESSYVTYEWAFALGLGIKVIPIMLKETRLHQRISAIHHFNFTNPIARPWEDLVSAVRRANAMSIPKTSTAELDGSNAQDIQIAKQQILNYLNENAYRMMSFERVRENIDHRYTDDFLNAVITQNHDIFSTARLKGEKLGIKKKPGAN